MCRRFHEGFFRITDDIVASCSSSAVLSPAVKMKRQHLAVGLI